MTLPDSKILPIIHTWAKILWKPGLDYDELVAIGYCAAKPLSKTKTDNQIASWIKWMITRHIYGDRQHKPQTDEVKNLSDLIAQKEFITYPPDVAIIDIKDAIRDLNNEEAQLIYMKYWRGMTLDEIASTLHKTKMWVRYHCDRVLGILRNRLLE